MGAGAASGSLDAANMLKPALARGSIRCIGATTPTEYKKSIETDAALERRFQSIWVDEPSLEKTRLILEGLKSYYEDHHEVHYSQDALEAALQLADRFLIGKQFPDKAIDLLDEAGAAASMHQTGRKREKDKREEINLRLEEIEKEKKQAVESERFEKAIELKEEEQRLSKSIDELQKHKDVVRVTITDEDIMEVVAEMTGISVKTLQPKEKRQLAGLEKSLASLVVGQNETVKQVANAIARAKLGFAPKNKPLASFLFIGPSGVGKTELGKAIAQTVFQSKKALLRLDMSEFSSSFTLSKLIGSPAGYVGYRENSLLSDHVKNHPHSVIIFDELEKAHPDVSHLLLQILDEGELKDATGKTVNFRNTIIVITSNIGSELFDQSPLGFGQDVKSKSEARDKILREKAREHFSRELINRLQQVSVFKPLGVKDLEKIAKKNLKELQSRLTQAGIELESDAKAAKYIAQKTNTKYGARDIQRVIEAEIEQPLMEMLIRLPKEKEAQFLLNLNKDGKLEILHKKKSS
jgi:ATP-dependent Clp protease ATP-binding subunit ClpC